MKKTWVKDLKLGQIVDDTFVIRKIDVKEYNEKSYLLLEFSDKTGYINGACWENADAYAQEFTPGNVAHINGKIGSYKSMPQINVATMVHETTFDPRDFLPQGPHDLHDLIGQLDEIIASIKDPDYKRLLDAFFTDKAFRKAFVFAPAAKLWHHSYVGGLIYHTLCITKMCVHVEEVYQTTLNRDLLITGAILHDIGKIETYSLENFFDYTDEGRLIGHTVLSDQMVRDRLAGLVDFPAEKKKLIRHMILSHHGKYEQQAPVLPQTLEANALYMLDLFDSQLGGILVEINKPRQPGKTWTEWVKLLDRFIYVGGK